MSSHFRGVSLERVSTVGCGTICITSTYVRIDNLNKPVAPTMKARNGGTVGVASVEQLQKNVYKYLTTRYN